MNETLIKGGTQAAGVSFISIGLNMVNSTDKNTMYVGFGMCILGVLSIFGREILKPYFDSKRK